ncbi:MAG: hypothetical protein ACFNX1_00765 [Treponema lecithinolyticum]|uniref:hypothetical protein n=1 Tax=Treponema lecithinolyticum TaxID=53418 RepID=UPI003608EE2D
MKLKLLEVIKTYAAHLQAQTGTQAIIMPSLLKSEKFHIELNLLPHPVVVGNGRTRLRLRATVYAEIPASDPGINDCLSRSVSLAQFFDQAEGFTIREKADEQSAVYGIAYHTALRDDDDLFSDLQEAEERSFSYNESWLVELEFNIKDFI